MNKKTSELQAKLFRNIAEIEKFLKKLKMDKCLGFNVINGNLYFVEDFQFQGHSFKKNTLYDYEMKNFLMVSLIEEFSNYKIKICNQYLFTKGIPFLWLV